MSQANPSSGELQCEGRAMKGEVDQLHKKISLGLRLGFSELRPRSGVWKDRKRRVEKRNFKTETLQCSVKNWII